MCIRDSIYLLPISLCTLYAGGYIAQFIRNYRIWTAAGNTPGNGSSPQMPSPHPAACFQAVTDFPYNLYGIGICLVVFGLLIFLLMRMGYDRNGEVADRERDVYKRQQGIDIDSISRRLGHADSRITREIYLHVTKRLQEKENQKIKEVKLI